MTGRRATAPSRRRRVWTLGPESGEPPRRSQKDLARLPSVNGSTFVPWYFARRRSVLTAMSGSKQSDCSPATSGRVRTASRTRSPRSGRGRGLKSSRARRSRALRPMSPCRASRDVTKRVLACRNDWSLAHRVDAVVEVAVAGAGGRLSSKGMSCTSMTRTSCEPSAREGSRARRCPSLGSRALRRAQRPVLTLARRSMPPSRSLAGHGRRTLRAVPRRLRRSRKSASTRARGPTGTGRAEQPSTLMLAPPVRDEARAPDGGTAPAAPRRGGRAADDWKVSDVPRPRSPRAAAVARRYAEIEDRDVAHVVV